MAIMETNSVMSAGQFLWQSATQGVGAFLGVVAGLVLTLLVEASKRRNLENQQVKNLVFEWELDLKKVTLWLEKLTEYRTAVAGDTPEFFLFYFDVSRIVLSTTDSMFRSGSLYKHLTHEEIGLLQTMSVDLSPAAEQLMNNEIMNARNVFAKTRVPPNTMEVWIRYKPTVTQQIMFWENKFRGSKTTLETLIQKLKVPEPLPHY